MIFLISIILFKISNKYNIKLIKFNYGITKEIVTKKLKIIFKMNSYLYEIYLSILNILWL
jgi:hypothetical protein